MRRGRFAVVSIAFALCLFVGMLAFLEIGRRVGVREFERRGAEARSGVGVVDSAVYSLLALLIGFTFSGAAARFDNRRSLVADEVNAIGTAWQRIEVLPVLAREAIREGFREYIDALLGVYVRARSAAEASREWPALTRAQDNVWTRAVAACVAKEGEQARMLLLPAMNDMFGAVEKERLARRMHPPMAIFAMLGIMALAAALFAGYAMSNSPTHNWIYSLGVVGAIAIASYVIVDLEYPRLGMIRIDGIDRALVELRETMG